jgi:UDP-galactose transporter B1
MCAADAAAAAAGISLFAAVKSSAAVLNKLASPDAPLGYLLVFVNLWLDAYTNAYQDQARALQQLHGAAAHAAAAWLTRADAQIKERHPKTTPQQLMCYMNAWCTLYYALFMFGYSRACACCACARVRRRHQPLTSTPGLCRLGF